MSKEKKKAPWNEIKAKYLLGMTPQELFLEYSSFFKNPKQISDKAYLEKWKTSKSKINEKVEEKIEEFLIDRNTRFLNISDMALDAVEEYFKDKQFKKHKIKYKYYDCGKPSHEELVAEVLDIPDTQAFSNMVRSLEVIQKGHRLAEGLDKDNLNDAKEPEINIINNLNDENI